MNESASDSVSFGPFCLVPRARVLYKSGAPVPLGSRALDILIALVERPGEVVKHRELLSHAWRGLVVDPGNLRVQVTYLRRSLGDGEQGARYIANVQGQGYSFVAPVRRVDLEERQQRTTPVCSRNRTIIQELLRAAHDDLTGSMNG